MNSVVSFYNLRPWLQLSSWERAGRSNQIYAFIKQSQRSHRPSLTPECIHDTPQKQATNMKRQYEIIKPSHINKHLSKSSLDVQLGALAANVIMGGVGNQTRFYLSAAAGALGLLVTAVFIQQVMRLGLQPGDQRWAKIQQGALTHGIWCRCNL